MTENRTVSSIEAWITGRLAEEFGLETATIDPLAPFESYGLASQDLVALSGELESWLSISLSPVLLYEHPTLRALATFLAGEAIDAQVSEPKRSLPDPQPNSYAEPIAIIGLACRFPGAKNADEFWDLLTSGTDAISTVPADRWDMAELEEVVGQKITPWGGFLPEVEYFDAHFFGISPREARHIDPQQRLLLEVTWEALAGAGIPAAELSGQSVGVFVGISSGDYGQAQFSHLADINSYFGTGSALSIAANRLSYFFDWRGPSIAVDTACSSSLVAVHMACQSLRSDDCSMAIAAGVNLMLTPAVTVNFADAGAMAKDGRCKVFDARADGYVRSEGAGTVVLKPLSRAQADNDRIYAVILGSAVNQDGRTNGLMAPNPAAQEEVLQAAYLQANIDPAEVDYVEAHGTGTFLGDPIEAKALGTVLGRNRTNDNPCRMGSVKSNIGHLEAAAGIAGLIKTTLALHHRQLPPSLHFETPNPHIPFGELNLQVQQELGPWPDTARPLAGVSSFGFGGTNAHIVLSAAAQPTCTTIDDQRAYPLVLSARSKSALRAGAARWREWLATLDATAGSPTLAAICQTAARRHSHLDHRLALVATGSQDAARLLDKFLTGESDLCLAAGMTGTGESPQIVFICPGQGSQWPGMAIQMWQQSPIFRQSLQRTAVAFRPFVDWELAELILDSELPTAIDVIQPVLFAISIALAEVWQSLGIRPTAVAGHSMGEVAAAHIAGVLSLEDAARVICERSKLLNSISGRGEMAVVDLAAEELAADLLPWQDRLSIAARNGPRTTVLSGDPEALSEMLERLAAKQIFFRRVKVDVAAHSPQVESLREPLLALLAPLNPQTSKIPIYSTVTGELLDGAEMGAFYWTDNLRQPVLFTQAINRLIEGGADIFLELSPHPTLLPAINQIATDRQRHLVSSLHRELPGWQAILATLAQLYAAGSPVDWAAIFPTNRPPVSLPHYSWQRERYWFATPKPGQLRPPLARSGTHPLLGSHFSLANDPQSQIWQNSLAAPGLAYLADHQIHGQIIFPGSAYLEMALAAARSHYKDQSLELNEIEFLELLPLPPGREAVTQIVLSAELPGQATFQIASQDAAGHLPWTVHARGLVQTSVAAPDALAPVKTLQAACPKTLSGKAFYASLASRRLNYGLTFQGITDLWLGDNQALARLQAKTTDGGYCFHPAFLDACLQTLAAAIPDNDDRRPIVPVSLARFQLLANQPLPGKLWCYARLAKGSPTEEGQLAGDVFVFDDQDKLLAVASGLRLSYIGDRRPDNPVASWFYERRWSETVLSDLVQNKGPWLLMLPDIEVKTYLLSGFRKAGSACFLAVPGPAFEGTAEDTWQLDPTQKSQFHQLLAALPQWPTGIVYGWSRTGAEDGGDPVSAALTITSGALHLIQALEATDRPAPRLYFLTEDANLTAMALPAAPLNGLARVINQEYPEYQCTTVQMGGRPNAVEIAALVRECLASTPETQVALYGGERRVARLSPYKPASAAKHPIQPLDRDEHHRLLLGQAGLLDSLHLGPAQRIPPGPGQIEIAVSAAGLNFLDLLTALGSRPDQGETQMLLGAECAGRVVAVGKGVENLAVGDEVFGLAPSAFSAFATTSADLVAHIPIGLSPAEAATIPVAFLTAYYALVQVGRLTAGERVLIHSAATGTGQAAVQIARHLGAEVLATAGSTERRARLNAMGISQVMDSRSLDFVDQIQKASHGDHSPGVDIVLNSLAGEAIPAGLSLLRSGGRFLELGKRDIYANRKLGLYTLRRNITISAVDLAEIAAQRPTVVAEMLEALLALFEAGHLVPLPFETFMLDAAPAAFRHMAQARHQGKIVLVPPDAESTIIERGIEPNAVYLITGGLGAIGLRTAGHLVDKGARHLALLGRSQPSTAAAELLANWRKAGVQVLTLQADVADRADLANALDRVRQLDLPLRGIFHAAGILDDGILVEQNAARFGKAMAPKVAGSWYLHDLTRDDPLDHFVLFGSAAAVFGSPGQGNYAAANAFLNELAHYRRSQNLPALSLNWGAWSEIGLAAAGERARQLTAKGIPRIAPEEGALALDWALTEDVPELVIMPLAPGQWGEYMRQVIGLPLLADLVPTVQGSETPQGLVDALAGGLRQELASLSVPQQRRDRLESFLQQQIAAVLHLAPELIAPQLPFGSLGLDSLMALEARNKLERELDMVLPASMLWNYPTLADLADYIALEMGLPLTTVDASPPTVGRDEARVDELANLSEEKVLQMLADKIENLNEQL